jgi:hypothetical protein
LGLSLSWVCRGTVELLGGLNLLGLSQPNLGRMYQSDYGGSSKRPNHSAWYISPQFDFVLTVPCNLFFYLPKNLGARFL